MSKYFESSTLLPRNDICVIDNEYLSEESSTYYFKSTGKIGIKYHFEDANNKVLYKCQYKTLSGNFNFNHPKTDRPLVKIKGKFHFLKPNDIYITRFKNGKEIDTVSCNIKVNIKWSSYRYIIEFYNKATEKNEIIEVDCLGKYKDCTIYYGLKKEKGIPICKFDSSKYFLGIDFKIDISPRVDTLFMLVVIEYVYHLMQTSKAAAAAS